MIRSDQKLAGESVNSLSPLSPPLCLTVTETLRHPASGRVLALIGGPKTSLHVTQQRLKK